jgi:hypothetical protein
MPWKGVVTVHKDEHLLHVSLKLTIEEFNDLWDAVVRRVPPSHLRLILRDRERPFAFGTGADKFEKVWNNLEEPHAEVWTAAFVYLPRPVDQALNLKSTILEAISESKLRTYAMATAWLLFCLLIALAFKR